MTELSKIFTNPAESPWNIRRFPCQTWAYGSGTFLAVDRLIVLSVEWLDHVR